MFHCPLGTGHFGLGFGPVALQDPCVAPGALWMWATTSGLYNRLGSDDLFYCTCGSFPNGRAQGGFGRPWRAVQKGMAVGTGFCCKRVYRLSHGPLGNEHFEIGVGRNIGVSDTSCSIRCSSECATPLERFPTARLECKLLLHAWPDSALMHPR